MMDRCVEGKRSVAGQTSEQRHRWGCERYRTRPTAAWPL